MRSIRNRLSITANNTCEITGKAHGEFANGKDEFAYNNFMVSRMFTAVNIAMGDDGYKAKEVLENFKQLIKMSDEKYQEQVKYYG